MIYWTFGLCLTALTLSEKLYYTSHTNIRRTVTLWNTILGHKSYITTLYGIITGSLSARFSRLRYSFQYDRDNLDLYYCYSTRSLSFWNYCLQSVAITVCGSIGLVGYNSGHLTAFNLQSGINRGLFGKKFGKLYFWNIIHTYLVLNYLQLFNCCSCIGLNITNYPKY